MKCHYFREAFSVTLLNASYTLTIILQVNVFIFLVTVTKSKFILYNYPVTFITFHTGLDWTSLQEGIFLKKFYLFLTVLCLHCLMGFSLVAASRGYPLVPMRGLPIVVTSFVVEHGVQSLWASVDLVHRLQSTGSIVVIPWLDCSVACVNFADQEPTSPASVGGFFTTEIVRKPRRDFYLSFPRIHFSINISCMNIKHKSLYFSNSPIQMVEA